MVTVLVVGGTGKTAQFTVHELLNGKWPSAAAPEKVTVRILSRDANKVRKMFPNYSEEQLEVVEGTLTDSLAVGRAVNGVDYVVLSVTAEHIGKLGETLGVVSPSSTHPLYVELQGAKALIDAAKSAKVKHFVFCSSCKVTQPWHPITILINALASFPLAYKIPVEHHLRNSGIPYTIVRPGGLSDKKEGVAKRIVLSQGDVGGGMISRVQTGRLFAKVLANPTAYSKTFECWEADNGKAYEDLAFDGLKADDLKKMPDPDALVSKHHFATRATLIGVILSVTGAIFWVGKRLIR
jgi:uncharacterized protein YbjT (DUF2867 family)